MFNRQTRISAMALALIGLAGSPALAIDIVLTDTGSTPMSTAQLSAFTEAAERQPGVSNPRANFDPAIVFEDPTALTSSHGS